MQNVTDNFLEFAKGGFFYEYILSGMYRSYVKHNEIIIDAGASKGYHTLQMAQCVDGKGEVLAIEPIPEMAEKLKENTSGQLVSVIEAAVSNRIGRTEFTHCLERSTLSGLRRRKLVDKYPSEVINVDVTMIDALVPPDIPVSFIKLDLEGGEFDAMQGAERTIVSHHPAIVFEHGGVEGQNIYGYDNAEYHAWIRNMGYNVYDVLGREMTQARFCNPDIWYCLAARPDNERHNALLYKIPELIVASAQLMTVERRRRYIL